MRGESGIDMIEIFALWLRKNGMETEQGGKIIERHFGKDLLLNERAFLGIKVR